MEYSLKFEILILKIISGGSDSQENAEVGHFTLFFAKDGKEMYKDL